MVEQASKKEQHAGSQKECETRNNKLLTDINQNTKVAAELNENIIKLRTDMNELSKNKSTYAEIVAHPHTKTTRAVPMHTIVASSENDMDSS